MPALVGTLSLALALLAPGGTGTDEVTPTPRPAWSEEGIYAALAKCHQLEAHEVALAAIRAAADKTAKTPGVIPARGSHWNEPDAAPRTPPKLTREQRRAKTCAECGAIDGCNPPAHEFVPLDQAARNKTRADQHIAAARAALTAARTETTDARA